MSSNLVVDGYIDGVLSGSIGTCKWARLAVERHVGDLATAAQRGIWFDEKAGQHILDFFRFTRHSKGEWAGQPIVLEPWQQFLLWVTFGWMRETVQGPLRRFRTAYVEVSRKNGKSTIASGIGLYMLDADGEAGAEVYSAATKRAQAKITFDEATRMVKASPFLRRRITAFRDNLHIVNTAAKFEPLGRDTDSMDGLNVHCALIDELHAHKNRETWDLLDTATGSRRQPLLWGITTAGADRHSLCYELNQHAQKVLEGLVQDDSFFGMIFTLDEGDDWEDEAVWIKANPNLGVSKKLDDMQRKSVQAKEMPSALNSFLRRELNIWTQATTRWVNAEKWLACGQAVDLAALQGRRCYGGLDLSSTTDVTALVLVFPPLVVGEAYQIVAYFWVPEETMRLRSKRDQVRYDTWVKMGFMRTTPGNVVDYAFILAELSGLTQQFDLQEVAFDRWGAAQLQTQLIDLMGEEAVIQFGQGFASMSGPMKDLERLILNGQLAHGANPVLTWMAGNLVVRSDPAGNIKPDKEKSTEKIDGMVGLVMALDRAIRHQGKAISVYEQRGIREL